MKRKQYILLAVTILVLLVSLSFAQSQGPSQPETSNKTSNAAQNQETPNKSVLVNKTPTTDKIKQGSTSDQTKTNVETSDERIAKFTFWLVIVASIQAAIFVGQGVAMWIQAEHLKKTVKATEKAANAAEASSEALSIIERAYVHARAIYQRTNINGDAAAIYTEITVWNYGKTPAIINVIKTLKNFEPKISDGQETDVFPQRFIAGILDKEPLTAPVVHYVRVEDWADIETSAKQLFFLVRVEYQDVFETSYTKDFWWVYKPIDRVWSVYKDRKESQSA